MKKSENEVKTSKVEKKKLDKKVDVKTEKKQKESVFKIISKYFKGVGTEIKRIRWTSGKELVKYSIASMAFVVLFGIYFYGIDWIALLVRSIASK